MSSLLETLFDSKPERLFFRWYHRLFSIEEIENSTIVQWVFGATVFSYFVAFNGWTSSNALTVDTYAAGKHVCWAYFQSCGEWLFLRALPYGYSQTFLYMALLATLVLAVYLMWRKEWTLAHLALLPSFVWHALGVFVFSGTLAGNYDYYLFLLAFVLLSIPHKLFFLKLVFVLLYMLASTIKIHEGWILGTYFSALETGMPLFPKWSIPIWSNLVIFMQIVGTWFLLSRRVLLQRIALTYFTLFHLYSGLIVEYHYVVIVLPTLLILFGPMYRFTKLPFDRRSIAGWTVVGAMIAAQSVSLFIPGDVKLTLEGNTFGLYMFEANHQCVSAVTVRYKDGRTEAQMDENVSARARCDPYRFWFRLQSSCKRSHETIERVHWTLDHSINGGPFLRIVDEEDACALEYRPFRHNSWIQGGTPVGRPVENLYY